MLLIAIVIFICSIVVIGFVFHCFSATGAQHVKLKAGWTSVEIEIDKPEETPPPRRQLDQPP